MTEKKDLKYRSGKVHEEAKVKTMSEHFLYMLNAQAIP